MQMNKMALSPKTAKSLRHTLQTTLNFARNWGRPLATYGVGVAILAIYFIDWRVAVTRIPFYRRKFMEDAPH
ncbi:hypothetical protein ACTXT7_007078 [Hymenolepis weldensis]